LGDPFLWDVTPGEPYTVRVAVSNHGTRLAAGRARVFSPDPRVHVSGTLEFPAASIGALQSRTLGEVTVNVTGIADDVPAALPLHVSWTTPETTWALVAALPLRGNVLRREGFESSALDVVTHSVGDGIDPWTQVSNRYEGSRAWQTLHYDALSDGVLDIGPITIAGKRSELRFHQKIDVPVSGRYAYDGGFLEASVDMGPWTLLRPDGDYPFLFGYSEGNDYPNQPCWGGQSDWQEIVVPFDLQGQVRFRFHFVSDFSGGEAIYDGWSVDALLVRTWDHAHVVEFEAPQYREGGAYITFDAYPLFDDTTPENMRVVRDAGQGDVELGRWTVDGRMQQTFVLDGLNPLRVERLWIEWSNGDRQGPLLIEPPGTTTARLLDPTPAILRRGEGGMIWYRVPGTTGASVHLDIYDVRGARVARLEDGFREAGSHVHTGFPGRDLRQVIGSGLYFLKFTGPGFSETRRIVVLPQ
jgi:hypothetical protein